MKGNRKFIAAGFFLVLFLALIAALKFVDVQQIGPEGTSVGLAGINAWFHELTGVNMLYYDLTDILGYDCLAMVPIFALVGLIQWIQRKNLWKVEPAILSLAVLYVVLCALYVGFEFVIINYRPIIIPGDAHVEASFPSSHTMLSVTLMGSTMIAASRILRTKALKAIIKILCTLMMLAIIAGRAVSGVHWLTDIVGGVLISLVLIYIYDGVVRSYDYKPHYTPAGKKAKAEAELAQKEKPVTLAQKKVSAAKAVTEKQPEPTEQETVSAPEEKPENVVTKTEEDQSPTDEPAASTDSKEPEEPEEPEIHFEEPQVATVPQSEPFQEEPVFEEPKQEEKNVAPSLNIE